ncbi:hypothetical protein MTO96_021596 [Rhipicephalus appendiculatus]
MRPTASPPPSRRRPTSAKHRHKQLAGGRPVQHTATSTLPHRPHHRAFTQERPGDQLPAQPGEPAASEPQPEGRGHLDDPGLSGHPYGLCYLEAIVLHADKGNPEPARLEEPWSKAAAQTMLESAAQNETLADWLRLLSVATNDLNGRAQRGAVQTTVLLAPDPRQQQRWRRRRLVKP